MRLRCAATLSLALAFPARAARAAGAEHAYVIAIGYNGVPVGPDAGVSPLRFADDDALAFYEFTAAIAERAHLLTVFDADTQRRRGDTTPPATPPALSAVRAAVADVRHALEEDARAGVPSVVYVYYSGHGTAAPTGEPALALLDGLLTRPILYDEILGALPARHVHLFVDACRAEGVVRPRDAHARTVPTTSDDLGQVARTTLARFPNVGAVLASTRDAETHEWDAYQGGIFTHEVLSGLRGAADVNGDRIVEYSELAAFLSSANREVHDPRAHLDAVTHPPNDDLRAAIVDVSAWPGSGAVEMAGAELQWFSVEDERGERIADVHAEAGHRARVVVPAARALFVRTARGEAEVRVAPGARMALEGMPFHDVAMAPRGAVEAALRRGLFAAAFGPAYYRGFIDRSGELAAVPLRDEDAVEPGESARGPEERSGVGRMLGWSGVSVAGALGVGSAVFGAVALRAHSEFDRTGDPAAADRYARDMTVTAVLAGAAVAAAGAGLYLLLQAGDAAPATHQAGWNPRTLRFEF